MASTATIAGSFGRAAVAFAAIAGAGAADATSLYRTLYGVDDGNDYGRYFAGQDPAQPYVAASGSVSDMIAQGVASRAASVAAGQALVAAGVEGVSGFGVAADALCEAVRQVCADPRDGLRILAGLAGFAMLRGAAGVPADALGIELYVLTARAVMRLRLAAAASLVRAAADYQPDSQQAAALVRDRVGSLLDALATKCADLYDDASAGALDAARVAVVEDLTRRGGDVAPVTSVTLGAALPAKVVAYRLYGDATRAGDLVARNDPAHPGFLPVVIEALSA